MTAAASWRDIPMPASLTERPRSAAGIPVPYVAAWTGEEGPWDIRPCEHAHGNLALFAPGAPVGKPIFGRMDPARQRECIAARRCQVCHAYLEATVYAAHLTSGATHMDIRGRPRLMLNEPPCCRACFTYAIQVCPALLGARNRSGRRPGLLRIRDEAADTQPVGVTVGPDDPDAPPWTHPDPDVRPYGYMKLAVLRSEAINARKFLAKETRS